MWLNTNIKYFLNSLIGTENSGSIKENKLIFNRSKRPASGPTSGPASKPEQAPETNETSEVTQTQAKKGFAEYRNKMKNSKEIRFVVNEKSGKSIPTQIINELAKGLKLQTKLAKELIESDFSKHVWKTNNLLVGSKNVKVSFKNGEFHLQDTAAPNEKFIKVDLNTIEDSFYTEEKARTERRENICTTNTGERCSISTGTGHSQLKDIIKNNQILKKIEGGKGYRVDFSYKNRPGKVNENLYGRTKIHDVLDLNKLGAVRMEIKIKRKDRTVVNAYYDMTRDKTTENGVRTFVTSTGTGERVRIKHGDIITVSRYELVEEIIHKTDKERHEQSQEEKEKAMAFTALQAARLSRERAEKREDAIYKSDTYLWEEYDKVLFGEYGNDEWNKEMVYLGIPDALQGPDKITKNWDKVPDALVDILGGEPFNLSSSAAKNYLKKVICGIGTVGRRDNDSFDLDSRVYAEDFLKYKVNGAKLYPGGYDKMIARYKKLSKQDELSKKEETELGNIDEIINGIARVLGQLDPRFFELQTFEKENDLSSLQPMLSGIPRVKESNKEKYKNYKSYKISNLVHANDRMAKTEIIVKISPKMLREINTLSNGGDETTLFMAHTFKGLVKKECIKKLNNKPNNKTYILTSLPKTDWSSVEKANKMRQDDALREWQNIREKINKSLKARRFISTIFDPSAKAFAKEVKDFKLWIVPFFGIDFKYKGDKREITQGNLTDVTTITTDFEKNLSNQRGYLDMMKKTSKHIKGTTIYEPNPEKVKTEVNKYLEFGLMKIFEKMPEGKIMTSINKLAEDFNISFDTSKLKHPLKANRMDNMVLFLNKVKFANLDPSKLTNAHVQCIKLGYTVDRRRRIANNYETSLDHYLSTDKMINSIQRAALKKGCPIAKLKDIEKTWIDKVEGGVGFGFDTDGNWVGGVGGSMEIVDWGNGEKLYINIGLGITNKGKPVAGGGISYKNQLSKNVVFRAWLSPIPGGVYAGGELAYKKPVKWTGNNYNIEAGVGGTAFLTLDLRKLELNLHARIGATWDEAKDKIEVKKKADAIQKIDDIEKHLDSNQSAKAVEAILDHPTFGQTTKYMKSKYKLKNEAIIQIYKMAREKWRNAAETNRHIPIFKNFQLIGYAGKTKGLKPITIGAGALITFRIPGTTKTYVIRNVHPKFNYRNQRSLMDDAMKKTLAKHKITNYEVASTENAGRSGNLYFSPKYGRANISSPEDIGRKIDGKEATVNAKSDFQAIKGTFTKIGLHAEVVPANPKKPEEGSWIAVTPLQIEGTRLKMLMDPALTKKGLILDKKNNRILLSASAAKKLFITRETYEFPFSKRGGMNLSVITFKANHNKSSAEIEADSPTYIEKRPGMKYTMVRGEMRGHNYDENVVTLEDFKNRQNTTSHFVGKVDKNGNPIDGFDTVKSTKEEQKLAEKYKFETFKNTKFEFNWKETKVLSGRMQKAIGINQAPEVKHASGLQSFSNQWWKGKRNQRMFLKHIATTNPTVENGGKTRIMRQWAKEAAKQGHDFSEQELNLLYSIMLHKAFTELDKYRNYKGTDKKLLRQKRLSEKRLTRTLKRRNELFRNYLTKHINNFLKRLKNSGDTEYQKLYPPQKISRIINFIVRNTMPQSIQAYRKWSSQEKGWKIPEGGKYATWTAKTIKGIKRQYMPSSYAIKTPEALKHVVTLVGPKRLKITGKKGDIASEAGQLILSLLSPVEIPTGNRENQAKSLLYSELALSVLSIESPSGQASPMVSLLGGDTYKQLIKIYETAKNSTRNALTTLLKTPKANKAFEKFKKIIKGIRAAQLAGKPTYKYKAGKKEFKFTIKTEVYSGAYRKCANGTVVSRQSLRVEGSNKYSRGLLWGSAKMTKATSVNAKTAKSDANLTLAIGGKGKGADSPDEKGKVGRKTPKPEKGVEDNANLGDANDL